MKLIICEEFLKIYVFSRNQRAESHRQEVLSRRTVLRDEHEHFGLDLRFDKKNWRLTVTYCHSLKLSWSCVFSSQFWYFRQNLKATWGKPLIQEHDGVAAGHHRTKTTAPGIPLSPFHRWLRSNTTCFSCLWSRSGLKSSYFVDINQNVSTSTKVA